MCFKFNKNLINYMVPYLSRTNKCCSVLSHPLIPTIRFTFSQVDSISRPDSSIIYHRRSRPPCLWLYNLCSFAQYTIPPAERAHVICKWTMSKNWRRDGCWRMTVENRLRKRKKKDPINNWIGILTTGSNERRHFDWKRLLHYWSVF